MIDIQPIGGIYPFIQEQLNMISNNQRIFKKAIRKNLPVNGNIPIPRERMIFGKFMDPVLEKIDCNKESKNLLEYLNCQ